MRSIRGRLLAALVATGALALAAPVSGASAFIPPIGFPIAPIGGVVVGGNQIGSAGCVGTNRPSAGGNNGSTSAQTCGVLDSYQGSQIGQLGGAIGPPTVIGSPLTQVNVSAGSITGNIP
jgi:hypothetical protein